MIESNNFSLMDKETQLQGGDVNLPKKILHGAAVSGAKLDFFLLHPMPFSS